MEIRVCFCLFNIANFYLNDDNGFYTFAKRCESYNNSKKWYYHHDH